MASTLTLNVGRTNTNKCNKLNEENYTVIDKFNPVFMCEYALKVEHKCKYAVCNKCKLEIDKMHYDNNGCTKTTRSSFKNVVDTNINDSRSFKRSMTNKYAGVRNQLDHNMKCDHTLCNLKPHYDTSYYEQTYLNKQRLQNKNFPFHCEKCKKEIRKNWFNWVVKLNEMNVLKWIRTWNNKYYNRS